MSSSPMTSQETMYVRRLGEYYGATAYALYPSRSMLEGLPGADLQSYVNNLAEWLAKGILLSQSLSRILISAGPLLLPEIRSGIGRKGSKYSLPARILDDLMICRTRAFFTSHRRKYVSRRIADMEDSEKRGESFIKSYLFSRLKSPETEELNQILRADVKKEYYIVYGDPGMELICEPDAALVIKIYSRILRAIRAIVVEVSDTDSNIILARRHVIPRILLYMAATYLHYGVASAGLYVSLSPKSDPPAVLFIQKRTGGRELTKMLDRVIELLEASQPPAPRGEPPCNHCVYAGICIFRRDHI